MARLGLCMPAFLSVVCEICVYVIYIRRQKVLRLHNIEETCRHIRPSQRYILGVKELVLSNSLMEIKPMTNGLPRLAELIVPSSSDCHKYFVKGRTGKRYVCM